MSRYLCITTHPDAEAAAQLATRLVEERLAACVNVLPGQSVYRWQGQIQRDAEVLLFIKTDLDKLEALEQRLRALHPYDVPAFAALPIERLSPAYDRWLGDSLTPPDPT